MNRGIAAFCHGCLRLLSRMGMFLFRTALWMGPAVGAVAALMGFGFWVMGIPGGASPPGYFQAWLIGFVALGCYLVAYAAHLGVALVSRLRRKPRSYNRSVAMIWACLLVTAAVMRWAWSELFG